MIGQPMIIESSHLYPFYLQLRNHFLIRHLVVHCIIGIEYVHYMLFLPASKNNKISTGKLLLQSHVRVFINDLK